MTPYVWLNFIIILSGNVAFCAALYLAREAMEGNISWFNGKDDPKRRW